ncbi:hypothetical protein GJ496_000306 [Pomphorhynchus laevis]|nr:hypothetical protein GJ496_000306 [Pomphorhynchus laevis]
MIPAVINIDLLLTLISNDKYSLRILEVGFGESDRVNFEENHVPGALFFDGLRCMDSSGSLCRGLPELSCFESYVKNELKISRFDHIILYDDNKRAPNLLAARTWWLFRAFGHDKVSVLNGGYCSWCKFRNACFESGTGLQSCVFNGSISFPEQPFRVRLRRYMISTYDEVLANVKSRKKQLVDSRSYGEFWGQCDTKMPGQKVGHIPGALNVPFTELLDIDNGYFLNKSTLRKAFKSRGVNINLPTIAMCNMGLTASSIILGLYELGNNHTSIYCGSWKEWCHLAPSQYITKV